MNEALGIMASQQVVDTLCLLFETNISKRESAEEGFNDIVVVPV